VVGDSGHDAGQGGKSDSSFILMQKSAIFALQSVYLFIG
jgi:hypothetical protein